MAGMILGAVISALAFGGSQPAMIVLAAGGAAAGFLVNALTRRR